MLKLPYSLIHLAETNIKNKRNYTELDVIDKAIEMRHWLDIKERQLNVAKAKRRNKRLAEGRF